MNKNLSHLKRIRTSYTWMIALLSLYFTVVLNHPVLSKFNSIVDTVDAHGIVLKIICGLFLFFALNSIFSLVFSVYIPYLTKTALSVITLISSIVSFQILNYDVLFTDQMWLNIFSTDQGEALSYLNVSVISWVVITGIIPVILICLHKHQFSGPKSYILSTLKNILVGVLSLVIAGGLAFSHYKDFASIGRNNHYLQKMIVPTYPIYGLEQYIKETYFTKPIKFRDIGTDSHVVKADKGKKPTLFFLVVGETARTYNYSLNGYKGNNTNSYTQSLSNLESYRMVQSCGTYTALSVPCMFSNMTRVGYNANIAHHENNLMDMLHIAGIKTLWIDNDGGSKGVAKRISYVGINPKANPKYCNGEMCYDTVLLKGLDKRITAMGAGSKVVAFHLVGSHGPTYYERLPKDMETFTPRCNRSDIQNCTHKELVNQYDDTIHFTDYVLSKLIDKLKTYEPKYNVALLYLSDHGESLGEDGIYLHGTPYMFAPKYQKHVPLITWFGDGFIKQRGIDMTCLNKMALNEKSDLSQDNLFSSVLGLMHISTKLYNPSLDMFKKCGTNA